MRCPTCRRRDDGESVSCRRCGTDLSTLRSIDAEYLRLLRRGQIRIRAQAYAGALADLRQAHRLRSTPEVCRALALACLGTGDYIHAVKWHDRASGRVSS